MAFWLLLIGLEAVMRRAMPSLPEIETKWSSKTGPSVFTASAMCDEEGFKLSISFTYSELLHVY
jgi:hypothetical protein